MSKRHFLMALTISLALFGCKTASEKGALFTYPETKKVDTIDVYFGENIADPYRWLEDDNSEETASWVQEQNKITFDYLNKIPFRDKINERLTAIWKYERMSTPFKRGKYIFYYKNDGVQNQSVLCFKEGLDGEEKVLLDPNTLSDDGTAALSRLAVSNDQQYIAYCISKAGSDWQEIFVKNIETGEELSDHIEWVKFSGVSWKGNGFYYSRYSEPEEGKAYSKKNEYHKVYYHSLGDPQEKDELIYEEQDQPNRNFSVQVSKDERFLLLYTTESTSGMAIKVKDLQAENPSFVTIVDNFEHNYRVYDHLDGQLIARTNKNASKYHLVSIDPANPAPENWKVIIPESENLLENVNMCGGKFIAKYLKDVRSELVVYNYEGEKEQSIELPGIGISDDVNGTKEDDFLFYSFENVTTPSSTYIYNITDNSSKLYHQASLNFNPDDFETKQVFYPSKDGTQIPMFITYKKGIDLNGNNPTFLYGYGGFNLMSKPIFRTDRMVFLEQGGIYAVANLRGGGEYGEDWHQQGILCNKQNVFDDFITAAEYLVKEKYTSHDKLAIHGRSNGGLLIGAVMTQRPDICKVALPAVGVLDMLRYHMFTIGWAWATDYGRSDNEEHYPCLIKYSPLHNVKDAAYPATMVMTADHDDRVVPAHSFKFAATLQEHQQGENPTLIRVDVDAGHGAGKPTSKKIEEFSDMWSFVFYNLGMTMQ